MRHFWYLPLESLKARYTSQLSEKWMPAAFNAVSNGIYSFERDGIYSFERVSTPDVSEEIKVGSVLDGVNRGVVSLQQMSWLLQQDVTSDDVVFLQDFFTPGLEALLYAWHLKGVKPRIYAMCHAQSVDEYDFTHTMRSWMRPLEIGWSRAMAGIFVGSTIHRDQMKAAGFECPIHVVGLPIDSQEVLNRIPQDIERKKQVIFCSRLNNEKNPRFMLEVAETFLKQHPEWSWVVTSSAQQWSSEVSGLLASCQALEEDTAGRFKMLCRLTKNDYYHELRRSQIQFNSSLQDYVSWCLLEATLAGCDLVYPDFRSFPECVDATRRYVPFEVDSALDFLGHVVNFPTTWPRPAKVCNDGRLIEMAIMLKNWQGPAVNVWMQPASYFQGVGLL